MLKAAAACGPLGTAHLTKFVMINAKTCPPVHLPPVGAGATLAGQSATSWQRFSNAVTSCSTTCEKNKSTKEACWADRNEKSTLCRESAHQKQGHTKISALTATGHGGKHTDNGRRVANLEGIAPKVQVARVGGGAGLEAPVVAQVVKQRAFARVDLHPDDKAHTASHATANQLQPPRVGGTLAGGPGTHHNLIGRHSDEADIAFSKRTKPDDQLGFHVGRCL